MLLGRAGLGEEEDKKRKINKMVAKRVKFDETLLSSFKSKMKDKFGLRKIEGQLISAFILFFCEYYLILDRKQSLMFVGTWMSPRESQIMSCYQRNQRLRKRKRKKRREKRRRKKKKRPQMKYEAFYFQYI